MSPGTPIQARELDEIRDAIEAELAESTEHLDYWVEDREQEGAVWKIFVDVTKNVTKGLDESLEGAAAWWPGPPKGGADVLSVVPEEQQINLRFATAVPPGPGQLLRIYPPRYLEALKARWEDDAWAATCLSWRDRARGSNTCDSRLGVTYEGFRSCFPGRLRERQARAFQLPGWLAGFLWGPPGTGKTFTLGAVLAQFLIQHGSARVLLLSTTNVAVDLALVSADKALEQLCSRNPDAYDARSRCFRVGNHFRAEHYVGHEHLLPIRNQDLIRALAHAEAQRPDAAQVSEYAAWKSQVEGLRQAIRAEAVGVLKRARLAAMTTTRAVFTFGDLHELAPYDLVVFDEASQVGLAHALAIAPLGRSVLFAGDPNQLAPIVQSERDEAVKWLGRSPFELMQGSARSTCRLNEQNRMARPICDIVSRVFYERDLRVADDCERSPQWRRERDLAPAGILGTRSTCVLDVTREGQWSQIYGGPIRPESADIICNLVCELTVCLDEKDILVLTPFRAQRTFIRNLLRRANRRGASVSTVHRAQGGERHTVIFDPVSGESPFLQTEDARRLINVAISRAKARLVVLLSPSDRRHRLLDHIGYLIERTDVPTGVASRARSICDFAQMVDFPDCALNKLVQIGDAIGRVLEIRDNGAKFVIVDEDTGRLRMFVTDAVRQNCAASRQSAVVPPRR